MAYEIFLTRISGVDGLPAVDNECVARNERRFLRYEKEYPVPNLLWTGHSLQRSIAAGHPGALLISSPV